MYALGGKRQFNGLFRVRIAALLLRWVRNCGQYGRCGLLNQGETGHEEVCVAVIQANIVCCRSVGGKSKRGTDYKRYGLGFGFTNRCGGVLAPVSLVEAFVRLC